MDSRRGERWVYEQGEAKMRERKEQECLHPGLRVARKAGKAREVGKTLKAGKGKRIQGVVLYLPVRGRLSAMAESRRIRRRLGWCGGSVGYVRGAVAKSQGLISDQVPYTFLCNTSSR